MNKTLISKGIIVASLALAFMFIGTSKAEASQTYYLNPDGTLATSCGAYCSQVNAYLATQNSNTNSTSSTSNNNGTSTSGTGTPNGGNGTDGGYVQYPYYVYKSFAPTTPAPAASSTYVQYPYSMYSYFQNPNPTPVTSQTYPTPIYTYYGKSASAQLSKYQQSYPSYSANSGYSPNTGFILTSVR